MSNRSGRSLVVIILIVLALIALLATKCTHRLLSPNTAKSEAPSSAVSPTATPAPAPTAGPEVLTPATLNAHPPWSQAPRSKCMSSVQTIGAIS
ncbi:MAG: hypothetical protein ABIZ04_04730 [Opitutus sp.]